MAKKFWVIIVDNKSLIYLSTFIFFVSMLFGYIFLSPDNPYIQNLLIELKGIAEKIKQHDTTSYMIFTIFLNNILTAIKMIVFGFLFGLFPILALIGNGMLIGFFMKYSVIPLGSTKMFLVGILPHGIIEIPAIIIAAAFGIKLGVILIRLIGGQFNRRNREYSITLFKETIKQIPIVIIGLTIMLIVAAIIESTLTGYLLSLFSN